MRKLANVMRTIAETPWAILPSQLYVILEIAHTAARGGFTEEEVRERLAEAEETHGPQLGAMAAVGDDGNQPAGYVAVLPVYGTIVPHATLFTEISGGASIDSLRSMLNAAADDDQVKAIIFDIDSPGGDATGVAEFARDIRTARERKPVIAQANYMAASAAYWIAAQADEIVVSPSSLVGSIGVYAAHEDRSRMLEMAGFDVTLTSAGEFKTEGNPFEPLSEEAKAHVQSIVDDMYDLFVNDVAAGRGIKADAVKAGYGQGRVLPARAAVGAGMADSMATLDQTIARVVEQVSKPTRPQRRAQTWSLVPLPAPVAAAVPVGYVAGAMTVADFVRAEQIGGPASTGASAWNVTGVGVNSPNVTPVPAVSADRRDQMPADPTREEETEVSTEAIPASAAQVDPALADVLSAVHEIRHAVDEMNAGRVDRSTIEEMQAELMELRALADAAQPRAGFQPEDFVELVRPGRRLGMTELHELPARAGARLTRIPVETIDEFHNASDNLLILSAITRKDPTDLGYYADSYLPAMQAMAMDSTTATEGDEWVPTLLSGSLIERVELQLRVVALFNVIEMPSNPFEIPGVGVRTRLGRASEQTADTGQTGFRKVTPATRKITLTAVKFAGEVLTSKEAEEDSIIPILDFIRSELTSQLAHDQEDSVINGDTTGSHQDSDVTDALDPRKNWMGLRKLIVAGAKTDGSNAQLTAAMLRVNRKKMGKYGVGTDALAHILSIGQYINLLSDANVLTVDKYGPAATIHTGELASIDGVPIIVSEYVRADLNASGVYDGATTNRGLALTANKPAFLIGNRRGVTVQLLQELYAEYDQDAVTISLRRAFACRYISTDTTAAYHYNLAA